ncbi:flagellar basal body P-ring protein FlgI, partial [Candidatus Poribacteria bacterium]
KDVRIAPVAVSHGSLNIQIKTGEEISQPPPLSAGETVIITNEDLIIHEEEKGMQVIRGGTSIDELVQALNLIGVTPRDMIVILQAIKKAGALHARLVIM